MGVLAWGGGRAFLGGIKGACPAPLISPNQHMLIGKDREEEGGGGGGVVGAPYSHHARFHTDYGSPGIFSPPLFNFTPTLCIYIYLFIYIIMISIRYKL